MLYRIILATILFTGIALNAEETIAEWRASDLIFEAIVNDKEIVIADEGELSDELLDELVETFDGFELNKLNVADFSVRPILEEHSDQVQVYIASANGDDVSFNLVHSHFMHVPTEPAEKNISSLPNFVYPETNNWLLILDESVEEVVAANQRLTVDGSSLQLTGIYQRKGAFEIRDAEHTGSFATITSEDLAELKSVLTEQQANGSISDTLIQGLKSFVAINLANRLNGPYCGNGVTDSDEECDWKEQHPEGTISRSCTKECKFVEFISACGNGIKELGESCDDGNTISGDGCSSLCTSESISSGGSLILTPGIISLNPINNSGSISIANLCGNGLTNLGEECDDGNTISGDGCSSACKIENQDLKSCDRTGQMGPFAYWCGDGKINQPCEECDDGNTSSGDGCNFDCKLELEKEICNDNTDNDNDGLTDCDDITDCGSFAICQPVFVTSPAILAKPVSKLVLSLGFPLEINSEEEASFTLYQDTSPVDLNITAKIRADGDLQIDFPASLNADNYVITFNNYLKNKNTQSIIDYFYQDFLVQGGEESSDSKIYKFNINLSSAASSPYGNCIVEYEHGESCDDCNLDNGDGCDEYGQDEFIDPGDGSGYYDY